MQHIAITMIIIRIGFKSKEDNKKNASRYSVEFKMKSAMQAQSGSPTRVEAAYYLGGVAEKLADVNSWTRPMDYYLLCEEEGKNLKWGPLCSRQIENIGDHKYLSDTHKHLSVKGQLKLLLSRSNTLF